MACLGTNLGPQDGRRKGIHWAMAAPTIEKHFKPLGFEPGLALFNPYDCSAVSLVKCTQLIRTWKSIWDKTFKMAINSKFSQTQNWILPNLARRRSYFYFIFQTFLENANLDSVDDSINIKLLMAVNFKSQSFMASPPRFQSCFKWFRGAFRISWKGLLVKFSPSLSKKIQTLNCICQFSKRILLGLWTPNEVFVQRWQYYTFQSLPKDQIVLISNDICPYRHQWHDKHSGKFRDVILS